MIHRPISTLTGLLALFSCTLPLHASAIPLTDEAQAALSRTSPSDDSAYLDVNSLEDHVDTLTRPSWFTSTLMARRLLALSPSGVISTVFPDPPSAHAPSSVAGLPVGLREYTADCDGVLPSEFSHGDNGDPIVLALRVATTFRNIRAGSNLSFELDWWDHLSDAGPVYPGLPPSPAALPRVTLFGYLDPLPAALPDDATAALEKCFVDSHPDAQVWLPGRSGSPHASFWARVVVTQAYWIGGFGDVQQIGWINMTEWKGIRRQGSLRGIGDGRGWKDVRLPGERADRQSRFLNSYPAKQDAPINELADRLACYDWMQ